MRRYNYGAPTPVFPDLPVFPVFPDLDFLLLQLGTPNLPFPLPSQNVGACETDGAVEGALEMLGADDTLGAAEGTSEQ